MVQHLDLGRRKALRVRIATAIHLEARSIVDEIAKRKQKDLISQIVAAADALWDESSPLDESLHALADRLPELNSVNNNAVLADLVERREALAQTLRHINCADCAGKNICRGEAAHDNVVVTQGGNCLDSLKELLSLMQQWCGNIYAELSDSSPHIELSTTSTHDRANQGLLDRFGVSGWHEVGRGTPPTSTVGLTIRDRRFNWESLCSLYYTFLHELVCHAFQALEMACREDADRFCPWSEGWMDRLAFELVKEWLVIRPHELPLWFRNHTSEIERISGSIHDYRYQSGPALPDPHGDRRRSASEAFGRLWQAWGRNGTITDHRITLFSIRLNLLEMSPEDRMQFGIILPLVLAEPGSKRYEDACGKCSEFAVGELSGYDFITQIRQLILEA